MEEVASKPLSAANDQLQPSAISDVSGVTSFKPSYIGYLFFALIVGGIAVSYSNSLRAPFVFDDHGTIQGNVGIHHLWTSLFPSDKFGLAGRPIASVSFALNYLFGKEDVLGYHLLNIAIHTGAALLLFGVVRRTLMLPSLHERFGTAKDYLAGAIALLWALHPIQTESVTYLSQRTESLMGLFYLSVLYSFNRSLYSARARWWQIASVLAAVLGAMTKEVIVTAPVIVLIYDRIFVASDWRTIWKGRRLYYCGLGISWLVIAYSLLRVNHGDIGFGHAINAGQYALTSCKSIVTYLRLAFFPKPLMIDYGYVALSGFQAAKVFLGIVAALVCITLGFLWRRPAIGFFGAWFFIILSPVSSFVPVVGQPTAEHRMYLPLVAVVAGLVLLAYRLVGKWSLCVWYLVAGVAGWGTYQRNLDYKSEISLWTDAVEKAPQNARAQVNLGSALERSRQIGLAIQAYQRAVEIDPKNVDGHYCLALRFEKNPARQDEAIREFTTVLQLDPHRILAYVSLGNIFFKMPGQAGEAVLRYRQAVQLDPLSPELHANLGNALAKIPGSLGQALAEFDSAIKLNPNLPDLHYMKALVLVRDPASKSAAASEFEKTLQLDPTVPEYHYNYGVYLGRILNDHAAEAAQYREAIRLSPNYKEAHFNLGLLLRKEPGREDEAIGEFQKVLRIDSSVNAAHEMIAKIQQQQQKRL